MNDNLLDILKDDARDTEWREWLEEAERAIALADPRRPATWAALKQPARDVAAGRLLTEKLRRMVAVPSPEDKTWCALYLLAACCRDNAALGYARDTFVHYYRTQHRAGVLFCMEAVGGLTLDDGCPHLNSLYDLMAGLAARPSRRWCASGWGTDPWAS